MNIIAPILNGQALSSYITQVNILDGSNNPPSVQPFITRTYSHNLKTHDIFRFHSKPLYLNDKSFQLYLKLNIFHKFKILKTKTSIQYFNSNVRQMKYVQGQERQTILLVSIRYCCKMGQWLRKRHLGNQKYVSYVIISLN